MCLCLSMCVSLHVCVSPSVWICPDHTSTIVDGFQNNLTHYSSTSWIDVPFEGFVRVGQRSRSPALDKLSLDNLLAKIVVCLRDIFNLVLSQICRLQRVKILSVICLLTGGISFKLRLVFNYQFSGPHTLKMFFRDDKFYTLLNWKNLQTTILE